MPSLQEVKDFRQRMFDESMALVDKKGSDYNRQQQLDGDTLFNLRVAELLGIVATAERGILVRLSDKFMRLISLMQPGVEAAVSDESVRDTVRDVHNYIDYALLLWEERRGAVKSATEVVADKGWEKLGDPWRCPGIPKCPVNGSECNKRFIAALQASKAA
jgi:hypothetical protein